jgi:transcription elongation factor Elf1
MNLFKPSKMCGLFRRMQPFESIQCPFCGQSFDLAIETNDGSQRLIVDCEICCRPLEISVECEAGEILSVDVRAN